ncbi:MAG TPA: glycosyl hydrolase family 18 protein, partial [Myxococcota bacterium]|nr:glycosyl hydrolase family 18 protein [Myxococcota bacterium]
MHQARWAFLPLLPLLPLLVLLALPAGPVVASVAETAGRPPGPGAFSPLPAAWEAHRREPAAPAPNLRIARDGPAAAGPGVVLGWLPHWTLDDATVRLDRLTHVAYFGVQVVADGRLGEARHWGTAALEPLLRTARDAGVRVVLTLICFDAAVMDAVLADADARAGLVRRVVDRVVAGGGDGVNVDFEGLRPARKADFVAFVGALKTSLDAALGGGSHVSVATPAVDWRGAYDYDELALAADALVIMGYEYHYPGGPPGPVAPLAPSERWGRHSLAWT